MLNYTHLKKERNVKMFDSLYDSEAKKWFPKFEFDDNSEKDEITEKLDAAVIENKELTNEEKAKNEEKARIASKNREISEKIFSILAKYGLVAENKDYGNGYFIFEMGDNSVVHFNFKGFWLKDWKFGMWIHSEYLDKTEPCEKRPEKKYPTVELFAQYKDFIDKFKPSASSICFDVFDDEVKEILELDAGKFSGKNYVELPFSLWDVVRCVKFMKYHPCLAYAGLCGYVAYKCERKFGYLLDFVFQRTSRHVKAVFNAVARWMSYKYHMTKMRLLSLSGIIESIVVVDWNVKHPGLSTSYDCEVWINFNSKATNSMMYSFYNRWFGTSRFGYTGSHGFGDHIFEIQEIHRYDDDNDENRVSVAHFRSEKELRKCIADRIHYYGSWGFEREAKPFIDYCKGWHIEFDGNRKFDGKQEIERLVLKDDADGRPKYDLICTDAFFVTVRVSNKQKAEIKKKVASYWEYKATHKDEKPSEE